MKDETKSVNNGKNKNDTELKDVVVLAAAAFSIIAPIVICTMLGIMAVFMLLNILF
ncbi:MULTISPECIES: hypothetical protein [Psychrilyobacter]|uniref:hypothetical protein n=1 Tax=Psychrilyobacter TaxID=623282 RepID=UPI00131438FC|nr:MULTISPECIES: hypothetical protein [Psychrilyobacter]MCS5422764.1 hypothetical protein [Psychrilyobacter sp. S5]NDI77127.1 hypothetical protein [Psychrilyobacter piezotolerans]